MTTSIKTRIAELLADPLNAARTAAEAGHRVIGYVGSDVPVELILAAGATPVRLAGNADVPTPHADAFMERAFLPEIRSIAEQWVAGDLNFIDSIVLARTDDSAQRLYYYVCELQRRGSYRGPRPLIHDIASIERSSSAHHTIAATLELARELGARESTLTHAAREVAAQAAALHEISARQQSEPVLRGSIAAGLARALHFCWNAQFRQELQEYLRTVVGTAKARRVLLVGSAAPDDRIHRTIENADASVVKELTEADWFVDRCAPEAPASSFEAIGLRTHARASLARHLAGSADTILAAAKAARADGVVIWIIEEDTTLGWVLPDQLAALKQGGVPVLTLTRQSWCAQPGTLREIERFCARLGDSR
jgi:hypothetical protein